jgi:predicted nucleic acid-binding protein
MKVAVKDANILIDLVNGELLELCLRLPYEFVTTDLVLFQLEVEAQWSAVQPFVDSGALRTVSLTGTEMEEVVADPIHSSLGLVDAQVLWLAAKEKGILLTGDLPLRQEAERRKVSVHGLLWILTQMVETGTIEPQMAAKTLRIMMAQGARLPASECERLLREWEK